MNTVYMNTDYRPIEMPKDDFGITEPPVSPPLDEAALKQAEATLAALPGPEPLPEIVFDPQPAAEPVVDEKPKRKRAAKAEAAPVVVEETTEAAKPVRKRKARVSGPEDGSAA